MDEWEFGEIGEYLEVQNGYAFKSADFADNDGIPVIKIKNVASGTLNMESAKFYQLPIDNLERYIIKKNDILIAMTGSHVNQPSSMVGKIARYTQETIALLNQRVGKIYSNDEEELLEDFIFYFFRQEDVTYELALNAGGSANQANVSPKLIKSLEFSKPPIDEQKAITAVLSSLDDKIYLLHRQNKTLEDLAQTLFRHWFIDEAEDFTELTELIEIYPKLSIKKGSIAPYLEMKNVQTDSCAPIAWRDREFKSGTRFQNGDTLMARITPCIENNKVSFVNFLKDDEIGWGSTEYLVLRAKGRLPRFYTYLLAKDPDFRSFAIKTMTGSSGRQRVQTNSLYDYELGIPSAEKIENFTKQVATIEQKLNLNATQIHTLAKIRDTLLPKLMSGEVRVKLNGPSVKKK